MMAQRLRFWLGVAACCIVLSIRAQDPEFSQYYAAPLYLNPGFTGTSLEHRFIANYRNQWPSITRGFETYAFSYDYNLLNYNSGIGFLATVDKAGSANLTTANLGFLYSYRLRLTRKWVLSSGLHFGYTSRRIDFDRLLFGDQLQFDVDGNAPTDDPILGSLGSANYFDFRAGSVAFNDKVWIGAAFSHLNRPNQSLLNDQAALPVKFTVHGGVRIPLNYGYRQENKAILSPSFVYKKQGQFSQLDVGAHFLYDPIVFGLWYRGIPVKQNVKDNISQDAVVVILGFQFEQWEVMYSYDFTVSELGPASGGTHEMALKYRFPLASRIAKKKRERFIPCPSFIRKNTNVLN